MKPGKITLKIDESPNNWITCSLVSKKPHSRVDICFMLSVLCNEATFLNWKPYIIVVPCWWYFLLSFAKCASSDGPLTRYLKLRVGHVPWMPGTFSHHRLQRKLLFNDPGMYHGTWVTHVPWCMSRSITRGGGKTFAAFPAHAQPAISRIWQEAHGQCYVIGVWFFQIRPSHIHMGIITAPVVIGAR